MNFFIVLAVALLPIISGNPANIYGHHQSYGAYQPAQTYAHNPAPSYGHRASSGYGYGRQAPSYGYEQPKHNCTVSDVSEIAEVCTPAFIRTCSKVDLPIKRIVDKEFCYTVTRTVCTETIEEIHNEICSYNYQQKQEATTAKTVTVSFKRETNVQMVTVCQPGYAGYGSGHHQSGYGVAPHQYCNEVAQETAYNVPVVTQINVDVTVSYPEPIKSCINKPILLPRVSCADLKENKCITVPEVQDDTESVEKCITQLGAPSCQKIELTLPKQACVELVYGFAHQVAPSYSTGHHETLASKPELAIQSNGEKKEEKKQ